MRILSLLSCAAALFAAAAQVRADRADNAGLRRLGLAEPAQRWPRQAK